MYILHVSVCTYMKFWHSRCTIPSKRGAGEHLGPISCLPTRQKQPETELTFNQAFPCSSK